MFLHICFLYFMFSIFDIFYVTYIFIEFYGFFLIYFIFTPFRFQYISFKFFFGLCTPTTHTPPPPADHTLSAGPLHHPPLQNKDSPVPAAPPLSPLQCGGRAAGGSAARAEPHPPLLSAPPSILLLLSPAPEGGSRRRPAGPVGIEIGGGCRCGLVAAQRGEGEGAARAAVPVPCSSQEPGRASPSPAASP